DGGELDFLKDRTIALEVSDLGWSWPITLAAGRLLICPRSAVPATRIRADTGALFMIAVGETDPDTLFFQRRLVVEGDTELGLALKNFLQATEVASPLLRLAMYLGQRAAAVANRRPA
ncbi:MAG: SCP2 sterol-binding domain-containing protein, partial [Halioglobus sp.]|nr:SCP2 sterol-binding domain-containing protein [Halioglobus sp.]